MNREQPAVPITGTVASGLTKATQEPDTILGRAQGERSSREAEMGPGIQGHAASI